MIIGVGIGKNDRHEDYVPAGVMITFLINAIRETETKIQEILNFLKEELPESLKNKYKQKLTNLTDTKYKYIYSIIELKYDLESDLTIYPTELKEILGNNFSSNIQRP